MDHPAAAESGPARPRQSGPGRSAVRRGRGVCARVLVGEGAVLRFLQDGDGEVVSFVTAVSEHDGKLLLGTLKHKSAFVYTLPA
eukprot:1178585-Prorocentrum_minimum.AAC.4